MRPAAALPPEFVLAAACCRWPPTASRDGAVRAAAKNVTDWARFLRVVKRHRVEGLVYAALAAAGVEPPGAVALALASRAQWIARTNLALTAETVRLQGLFDASGIPVLVLKGIALALSVYGSAALKHSKDIDILVPAKRAADAWMLLEQHGYHLRQPAAHLSEAQRLVVLYYGSEIGLVHPVHRAAVELRWRLVTSPSLLSGIDAGTASRSVALPNGAGIRTLNDDDLFAYLCVHGADHGWSRLKWLADLNAFLADKDDDEISRLYRHACGRGAEICTGLALILCNRLFSRNLPASLQRALSDNRRLRILNALAMNLMVGPDPEAKLEARRFGTTRVAIMRFLLGGGWDNFAAQCRALSIRLDDVLRLPLPAPLHFVYPLLRVPIWLWRRGRHSGPLSG